MSIKNMGPCQVSFYPRNNAFPGFTIAKTRGAVRWTEVEQKSEIKYDQTGDVRYDAMSQGHRSELEVPLGLDPGVDWIATLPSLDPGLILKKDANFQTNSKRFLARQYRIGALDSDPTNGGLGEMWLVQYLNGVPSAAVEDRIIFPAVVPFVDKEMPYDAGTQRAWRMRAYCYPDNRRADNAVWLIGDYTAT